MQCCLAAELGDASQPLRFWLIDLRQQPLSYSPLAMKSQRGNVHAQRLRAQESDQTLTFQYSTLFVITLFDIIHIGCHQIPIH